jgi:glycerate 2-kinase
VNPELFRTKSLTDPRVLRILNAALGRVEPYKLVGDYLIHVDLPKHDRLFLLGFGKAAEPMTRAAADSLDSYSSALVISKHVSGRRFERTTILEGGHPVPDQRSLAAGAAVLEFVSQLGENDLLLCLISGGGSALVSLPPEGIHLQDVRELTSTLLRSGASIDEINLLRRRLDLLKGGGLAHSTRARIVSLIISDVIGDRIEAIASGPTAEEPAASPAAHAVMEKYQIKTSAAIQQLFLSQPPQSHPSKAGRIQNIIIGNNSMAAQAALACANSEGFDGEIMNSGMRGEARELGRQFAIDFKRELNKKRRPFCLIAGGETTVTIKGEGKGGRNQELALAAVNELDGEIEGLLISLATDGEDGQTDAAGAAVNGWTRRRAEKLGMFAGEYLSRNDAYSYFNALDDLIRSGPTRTNVNDLVFLIGF